jgi:hypothetical protein
MRLVLLPPYSPINPAEHWDALRRLHWQHRLRQPGGRRQALSKVCDRSITNGRRVLLIQLIIYIFEGEGIEGLCVELPVERDGI